MALRMMATDLTVVVATYERPRWLAVSLRSILTAAEVASQRGTTTRVLVVDDGSTTTQTQEVCAALRVEYMRNPENDGHNDPSAARALGLARVDTEFYAMFDDDDVMLPRWIVAHLEAIGDADVCFGAYTLVDSELRALEVHRPLPFSLGDLLHDHNAINDYSLVRSTHLDGVWRPELRKAMPYGAWLELAIRGASFQRLTEPTFLYRRHAANMSDEATTDADFSQARACLIAEYRRIASERYGEVPSPSRQLRLRRAIPFPVKHAARRLVRLTASRPR